MSYRQQTWQIFLEQQHSRCLVLISEYQPWLFSILHCWGVGALTTLPLLERGTHRIWQAKLLPSHCKHSLVLTWSPSLHGAIISELWYINWPSSAFQKLSQFLVVSFLEAVLPVGFQNPACHVQLSRKLARSAEKPEEFRIQPRFIGNQSFRDNQN